MKGSTPTSILVVLLAMFASVSTLSGCGSSGTTAGTSSGLATSKKAKGAVSFTVTWPAAPAAAPGKVVPVAANSLIFTLVSQSGTPTANVTYTSPPQDRPTSGPLTTTFQFTGVELGTYTATVSAFPNRGATGTTQAIGTSKSAVAVIAGVTASIPVIMQATVDYLVITAPATYVPQGSTLPLTVTAFHKNATPPDSQVLVTNSITGATAITWTSSNSSVLPVSASTGLVTASGLGTATIQAQYIDGTTPAGNDHTGQTATVTINSVVVGLSTTASWAKFHGDPQNTGQASALVTKDASIGSAVAAFKSGNVIDFSSPAVDTDGTLYVGSWDQNIYALKKSGNVFTKSWSYPTGSLVGAPSGVTVGGIIESSPAISASGIVYAGCYNGVVYAFTTTQASSTAVPLWTFATPGVIHGSPAIGSDGTVYIGGSTGTDPVTGFTGTDNTLYALNGLTGALKWSFSPGTAGGIQTAPALSKDGSIVYVGDLDGNVYAITTATGTVLWSYQTGGQLFSSSAALATAQVPTGSSGTLVATPLVFIGAINTGGGADMFALNAITGAPVWTAFIPGGVYASPAVFTDPTSGFATEVYVGSYDTTLSNNNAVFQLAAGTGVANWQYPTAGTATPIGPVASSPVIGHNGSIYFGSDDGNVYSVLPTGTSQWPAPVQVGNPAVDPLYLVESTPGLGADGTVYIGCWNGKVIAIQ